MLRAQPELTPRASQASVPTDQRQRLTSSRVLTTHVPEQTDSFILYIKAMVLLSKVKIFNLRFKSKFQSTQGAVDPRDTSAFKGLNSVISSFISSFPEQFREPIQNDVVDTHLYVAHLVPHAYVSPSIFFFCSVHGNAGTDGRAGSAPHSAMLLLHDPHADSGTRSHERLSAAAHAILDLVYLVCSSNHDLSLLDPTVIVGFFSRAIMCCYLGAIGG